MIKFAGTIRPLRAEDLTDVELILREWIRHTDTREIVEDEVTAVIENMRLSVSDSTKRYYLVAATDGRVVGVMGLYVPDVGEAMDFATTDKPFEVINAYVAGDQRGNGVGQALADAVEELGHRLGRTELVVMSGSRNRLSGFGFWDKRYGVRVGFEPDHYGPGRERVAWRKLF